MSHGLEKSIDDREKYLFDYSTILKDVSFTLVPGENGLCSIFGLYTTSIEQLIREKGCKFGEKTDDIFGPHHTTEDLLLLQTILDVNKIKYRVISRDTAVEEWYEHQKRFYEFQRQHYPRTDRFKT